MTTATLLNGHLFNGGLTYYSGTRFAKLHGFWLKNGYVMHQSVQ